MILNEILQQISSLLEFSSDKMEAIGEVIKSINSDDPQTAKGWDNSQGWKNDVQGWKQGSGWGPGGGKGWSN